jgi:beta-phosphoglucomutase-like phosphatase (HAD superfamily)
MQGFRYFNDSYLNYLLSSAKMIVFDMNGLIIDDETVQLKSVNQTLEALHLRISEDCWTANCVGKRADEYFSSILSKNNINHDASFISDLVKSSVKAKSWRLPLPPWSPR